MVFDVEKYKTLNISSLYFKYIAQDPHNDLYSFYKLHMNLIKDKKFVFNFERGLLVTSLQTASTDFFTYINTFHVMKNSKRPMKCVHNSSISSCFKTSLKQFKSFYDNKQFGHAPTIAENSLHHLLEKEGGKPYRERLSETSKNTICLYDYSRSHRIDLYAEPKIVKGKALCKNGGPFTLAPSNMPINFITPIGISIDSEYKDLNSAIESPFDNKRDVYPISLSTSLFSFQNHTEVLYRNYIYNNDHYGYLKQSADVNPDFKESLRHCPYRKSHELTALKGYNLSINDDRYTLKKDGETIYDQTEPFNGEGNEFEKSSICIFEKNIFKLTLDEIDSLSYDNIHEIPDYDKTSSLHFLPLNYIRSYKIKCTILPIYNFYSFKDFRYFFGDAIYHLIEKYITVRRRIGFKKLLVTNPKSKKNNFTSVSSFAFAYKINDSTHYIKIRICDLNGLAGGGLKDLAATTGVSLSYKNELNKEDMVSSLIQKPDTYLQYCVQDTIYLFQMAVKFTILTMLMYKQFNITHFPIIMEHNYTSIKLTNGSNVAKLISEYVYSLHPAMRHIIQYFTVYQYSQVKKDYMVAVDGNEMASAKYLQYLGDSALTGSFVSGGRCCTERPKETNFSYGADIDLVSCYGNSIKQLTYPVGIPAVFRYKQQGDAISLRTFLAKKEKDLVPGCWYAVVSTLKDKSLKYYNDLFVSKIISGNSKGKSPSYDPEDISSAHVQGEQLVLCKEVRNAILVQEHLDIIRKIGSNDEKSDLYDNLYVDMALYYPKKYMCINLEDFITKTENYTYNYKNAKATYDYDTRRDERPYYWHPVPMDGFVGPLIAERKLNQQKFKNGEGNEYNSRQLYYKKTINMIYGTCASEYFPINHLCFANNITGRAKACVWIMSKALNSCMSITDGGIYELPKVNYFWHEHYKSGKKGVKKPGLNSLFSLSVDQIGFYKPLGSMRKGSVKKEPDYPKLLNHIKNTKNHFLAKKLNDILNKIALEHIHEFCDQYKLRNIFIYEIEHKTENVFINAAALNRGHYALHTIFGEKVCKARGFQQDEGIDYQKSELFSVLLDKAENKRTVINNLSNTHRTLLKPIELARLRQRESVGYKTGIHDAYVYTKQLSFKMDSGKFSTYANFKYLQSKFYKVNRFDYLNHITIQEDDKCIFNGPIFWKSYHEQMHKLCFGNAVQKRFSKNANTLRENLFQKGSKIDARFEPQVLKPNTPKPII